MYMQALRLGCQTQYSVKLGKLELLRESLSLTAYNTYTEIISLLIYRQYNYSHQPTLNKIYLIGVYLQVTGLAPWVGEQLTALDSWPQVPMMMMLCLIVATLTEIVSNPATATLLMPIMIAMVTNTSYSI